MLRARAASPALPVMTDGGGMVLARILLLSGVAAGLSAGGLFAALF
jgi:hypothetical protein